MTTQPTPLSSQSVYALSSLCEIFTAALKRKQEAVDNFNKTHPNAIWAAAWPEGNSKMETLVVDWLDAQAKSGATQIITKDPISAANGDFKNSLYMQIRDNRACAA
jgi:lambda repressor-like predicted transcriptional regulator